jgi:predicted ATPase/DNA-binding CsgD family transcriptional regulator
MPSKPPSSAGVENGGPHDTRGIVAALTMGQQRDNLPPEVTRFIGRRRELPAIAAAIDQHRLVTLRGAGGVGKTRLALRVAREIRDDFADGSWLVELSALRDYELLPGTVSAALGLPDEATGDPLEALAANLAERELLLVLDTCEHLVEACGSLARTLLAAAPGLRILATSREPLGVPAEQALLISPLELPAPGWSSPVYAAARSDAVALFVDRAQAAVPGFALSTANTVTVAELCRRLDGIPLALELAAVRLRGMPADEILTRLTDRFRILGAARTATGRHRTLGAAIAWSYDLCTPAEQRLWAELSVFPAGFGLAAAERVCGPGTATILSRLVEKSVVQYGDGSRRYQLLEAMREFGAERLAQDAARAGVDLAGELRARHRDYYRDLAAAGAAAGVGAEQTGWLARLGAETDNLRAALDFSFAPGGRPDEGLLLTTLLRPYWLMVGQFTEGRRWHDLAAAVSPGSPENAWAVFGAGILAVQQGDLAAGAPLLDRAAALAAAGDDENLAAHVSDARGIVAFNGGDLETAQARYEAALASYERIGFGDPLALVTYSRLASACILSGALGRAVQLCDECLRRCDETGEQWARGTALWVRGATRWLSGDITAAIADALSCLRIKESVNDLHTVAMSFDLLAVCRVATAEFELATVLYGAGEALWTLLSAPVLMGLGYAEIRKSAADTARAALGEERFEELLSRGLAMHLADALAMAKGETPAERVLGPEPADSAAKQLSVQLTRREKEIAALVAAGLGNREIAARLYLSKRTVDSHMEHIFTKLGFSSRTQLASWMLAQGRSR